MDLNRLKPWLAVTAAIVVSLVIGALWTSYRLVKIQPVAPDGQPTHTLDVISLQIGILTVVVAFVAIALAVVGIFGYQSIKGAALAAAKDAAERKAEEHAIRTATDILAGLTAQQGVPQQGAADGNPEPQPPLTGKGVKVEREA